MSTAREVKELIPWRTTSHLRNLKVRGASALLGFTYFLLVFLLHGSGAGLLLHVVFGYSVNRQILDPVLDLSIDLGLRADSLNRN